MTIGALDLAVSEGQVLPSQFFVIKQLFVQHFTILVLGVVARGAGYPRVKKIKTKVAHIGDYHSAPSSKMI